MDTAKRVIEDVEEFARAGDLISPRKESPQDKYARVQIMLRDDGDTWDLSPRDKEALRHVLGMINALAKTVAKSTGQPIPYEIARHAAIVQAGEKCE